MNFRVEQGQDRDDYTIKPLAVRGQLHQTRDKISDERFVDILPQGHTGDYEFVKIMSVHRPNFGIDSIQSMMRHLYIDRVSRLGDVNKIAGRGVAMATTRKPRKSGCYNCQYLGHIKRHCTNSKQERCTASKWCSPHYWKTYCDVACNAQE